MDFVFRLAIGAVVAAVVAAFARRAGSLSASGAVAAAAVGTAAVGAGWNWAVLLLAYFVSSSVLSHLGRQRKRERMAGMIEKAGPRDAVQVLSNGLPFTILAVMWGLSWDVGGIHGVACSAATSLAASAADTWGTEIGTWVGGPPRSILTGRRLRVGQSGGVSGAGLLGSLAGACFVAVVALYAGWSWNMTHVIVVGGFLGALADSFAGALVQQRRWCDACATPTEMHIHDCGSATREAGGLRFMTNDAVNLLATTVGALLGLIFPPPIA